MADRNTVNQTENNMQGNNTNPAANRENVPDGSMTIGNTGEVTAARGGSVSKELREHREGRNADVKINIVKNDGVVVGYMVINEYSEAGRVSHITAKQSFDGHIETATFDVNFIDVSQACRYTDIGLFLSALCVENLKETDLYQKLINYIDRIYSLSGLNLGDDIKNSIISACISGLRQSGGKLLRERNYLGSALMAKSLIEGCRKINLDAPVENKGNHADNAGVKDKNTPTPQGNNTTDQKPQGNNTADQTPQGNNTANQTPQGNNTADQTPQGNNTANQTLQGNNTANQTLQGNNTANQTAQREKTLDEYKKDDGNFHRASINRVERYLRGKGKKDFFVFLSAVTTCLDAEGKPKKTLEYDIAVKLHKLLKSRGIGSFWWEDSKLPTDWYISAKIATGLVTSSVFVGLAFDTAVLDKGNKYIYKCLNEKENVPNCFFYEFETFRSFCSNKTGENKDSNVEQFVKPFKSVLPSKRHQLFFVPDDERAIDFDESVFNNKDILQRISFSNDDSQKENIVIQILAKIGQILFFNKKEYKDANRSWKRSDHFRRNNAGISEEEWFSTLTAEERKFVSANIYNDDKETMELFAPLDVKDDKDLTEDTCAVSSDYFFEYSIVNKDGQNAKKQFTLFPRQGQDRNGNIIWELCAVIKDWSYAQVDADDILSRTHQQKLTAEERNNLTEKYKLLGFDEVTIYSDTEKIKTIKRAEYLNRGIAEFAIDMGSTNGRLVFRQNGKGAVKEYYFFVDFFYKKIRYYKLRKKPFSNSSEIVMLSKDKIPVKVDVRRHQSNMAIFRDSQLYLGMSGVTIGNGDRIKVERSGEYCLVPSGKDKAYYLFLQNNPIKGKDLPIKSKKLRCPYCGRFLSDSRTKANNPDYCVPRVDGDKFFCTHNFIYKFFAPMELGGITTKDFSPTDGKALGPKLEEFDREIQNNTSLQIRLPDKIDSGAIISLVGISKSGKSTFISELFSSQNQDDSFIVSSPIASKIPGCIASDIEVFAGTEVDNVQEFTQNSSDIPLGGMSGKIIRDRYNRTVFKQFVAPTSNHEAFPIITAHIPLVLHIPSVQMKDSHTYLSFFDTAGGLFKKGLYSEAEDCTMIYRSDCIILLLNAGENSTQNADGLGCAAANEILKTIIQRRPKKLKNMQDSVALAIVVNKFDKIAGEFDENSHVRCSPPFADENRFKDSARHDYINQCSEEVEEYIKKKDPEGGEALLKTIKDSPNGFVHHKFFAVSSVGRSDSILHPKDGETKMLFKSQSSHMEDVLLWLMYKTGIIL